MNGEEFMERLLGCDQAMDHIPLELQATLPLPCGGGERAVACWYYRLDSRGGEVKVWSPALRVVWDADTMTVVGREELRPALLGSGGDILDPAHRRREDAYLNGPLTDYLAGGGTEGAADAWLAAAPAALRPWLREAMKEVRHV